MLPVQLQSSNDWRTFTMGVQRCDRCAMDRRTRKGDKHMRHLAHIAEKSYSLTRELKKKSHGATVDWLIASSKSGSGTVSNTSLAYQAHLESVQFYLIQCFEDLATCKQQLAQAMGV